MNDDELLAALERRVATPLSADERNDLIRAARSSANQPQRRSVLPQLLGLVAAAAAIVVLAIVALPILLSPPVAGPTNSPVAQQSVTPTSESPAAETPVPSPSAGVLTIYSTQDLARMVGDESWLGKTVLAQATMVNVTGPPGAFESSGPFACEPPDPCQLASLLPIDTHVPVLVGWRDAPQDGGRPYDDGSGTRWLSRLSVPSAAGIFAFTIRQGAVELLGPASLSNGSPKDVSDLLRAPDTPSDDVEVVTGYLVRTPPISCPMPEQGLQTPVPDLSSFYCGGSWLTASPVRTANVGPGVDAVLVVDNGLHAQLGAYEQFAPDPAYDENYAIPREATYLIRNAGCPPVVMGDCPVWRMVGRLDDRATEPEATPLPTASLTPSPVEPSPSPEAVVLPPGIELNQAIGIARRVVAPDATLWGYAAGTYRDVRNLSPGADREVQPPDSITWDSLVWGIQFKSNVEICPPPPNAGQSPDPCETRPGLSSVYLDYHDGTWITTAIYSPSAGTPLPTPFHLMPVVSSPEPSSYAPESSGPVFVSCPEALTTGRLVENADGGLDLERSDGTTVMVEWAFSLRVGTVNGRLAVVNANGEPLAYAGDLVEVGGGAVGAEGVAAWYACGGLTVLESAPPTAGP